MKAAAEMVLTDNLEALNHSHRVRHLESQPREVREPGTDQGKFLLSLTEIEMQLIPI